MSTRTALLERPAIIRGSGRRDSRSVSFPQSRVRKGLSENVALRSGLYSRFHSHGDARRRGQNTATARPAAAPSLTIPRFDAGIPTSVVICGNSRHIAEFVYHALAVGLIKEKYWNGNIVSSAQNAIIDEFCLIVGTDGPFSHLQAQLVPDVTMGDKTDRGAVEFIVTDGYPELFTEKPISELEEFSKGAGFAVLQCINRSLHSSVGGGTIPWCADWIICMEDSMDEDDGEMGEDGQPLRPFAGSYLPTIEEFKKLVPLDDLPGDFDIESLQRARSLRPKGWMKSILDLCLSFAAVPMPEMNNYADSIQDTCGFLPVVVRWNEHDRMDEVIDSFHEDLSQMGTCEIVLATAFMQNGSTCEDFSPASAADQVMYAYRAVGFCDQALRLLCPQKYEVSAPVAGQTPVRVQVRY